MMLEKLSIHMLKNIFVSLSGHTMPNKLKSSVLNIKELKGNVTDYFLYSCYTL